MQPAIHAGCPTGGSAQFVTNPFEAIACVPVLQIHMQVVLEHRLCVKDNLMLGIPSLHRAVCCYGRQPRSVRYACEHFVLDAERYTVS
jgi:hypothetical protein